MPDLFGQPTRLMRSRRRGSTLSTGARYVGRPTLYGNPFAVMRFGHHKAVNLHRAWLGGRLAALSLERLGFDPVEIDALFRPRTRVLTSLHELHGCDLVCWCALTAPCHADELLRRAPLDNKLERLAK